jgi:uncharacterized protein YggE
MKTFLPLFIALTSFALADGLPTVPYLYVEGSAEVEKKADVVSLIFRLSATDKEVTKANSAVQVQAQKVFALLKTSGIADEDVVAGDIESSAEYDQTSDNGPKGKFLGYDVQRPFTVKVRDLAKFPNLVNALFAANVRYFIGVTAEYSKAKETEQETQEMAIKDARAEADRIAKIGGMKVDSVWAMSTLSFPQIEGRMLGAYSGSLAVADFRRATKAEVVPEYRLAPIKFNQSIQVIFLISPAK